MSADNKHKRYYERNKLAKRASALLRYHLNKEKTRERRNNYAKKYYQENKGIVIKKNKLWALKNPEKHKKIHADVQLRRRARLSSVANDGYKRMDVFNRFGGVCIVCDELIDLDLRFPSKRSFTIHHLIPISKGGDNTSKNVAPAHFYCNVKVGNKVPIAVKPKVLLNV